MRSFSMSAQRLGIRRTAVGQAWSAEDLKLLRELASAGVPLQLIAARLRRSASSVRNKATMQGVSLTSRMDQVREPQQCGEFCDLTDKAAS